MDVIMKNMYKKFFLTAFLFFGFVLNSCEDDALLAPQAGDSEDGGSYGAISFPTDPQKNKTINPETF